MVERDRGTKTIMSHGIKNEIIENTIVLIATKGSWSISVQEIADACKTTPASLYTYFGSKKEIFEEAREEMEKRNPERQEDGKEGRFADHRELYREALNRAGISTYTLIRGDEGSWIQIAK